VEEGVRAVVAVGVVPLEAADVLVVEVEPVERRGPVARVLPRSRSRLVVRVGVPGLEVPRAVVRVGCLGSPGAVFRVERIGAAGPVIRVVATGGTAGVVRGIGTTSSASISSRT